MLPGGCRSPVDFSISTEVVSSRVERKASALATFFGRPVRMSSSTAWSSRWRARAPLLLEGRCYILRPIYMYSDFSPIFHSRPREEASKDENLYYVPKVRQRSLMKIPRTVRGYCPHCNKHTELEVERVKNRPRSELRRGQRRFRSGTCAAGRVPRAPPWG